MQGNRTLSALEGIALLQGGGAHALKYGRAGKPHRTTFTLSQDGSTLSWKSKRHSLGSKERNSVHLPLVSHFLVGRESAVFKRFQQDGCIRQRSSSLTDDDEVLEDRAQRAVAKRAPGREHLSLSLQFGWVPHEKQPRETLDLSFDEEESFGLWVAALRALVPASALGPDLRSARDERDVAQPSVAPRLSTAEAPTLALKAPPPAQMPALPRPTATAKAELEAMLFAAETSAPMDETTPPPTARPIAEGETMIATDRDGWAATGAEAAAANPFANPFDEANPFEANPFDFGDSREPQAVSMASTMTGWPTAAVAQPQPPPPTAPTAPLPVYTWTSLEMWRAPPATMMAPQMMAPGRARVAPSVVAMPFAPAAPVWSR